jgi:hypothetical protein
MDSAVCVLPVFIVVILIIVFMYYLPSISNKEMIEQEVHRNGGQIVNISYKWFDGGQYIFSYDVVFTDQFGKKYQTSCQVSRSLRRDQIYWTQTPRELISGTQPASHIQFSDAVSNNESLKPNIASSKEQIIDDLHQDNLRLKRELEQLRKNNNMDDV